MVVMSFMDPKLAQVLPAVNVNVHYLQQMNDTPNRECYNGLHTALSIKHAMHILSHGMPVQLNPLA